MELPLFFVLLAAIATAVAAAFAALTATRNRRAIDKAYQTVEAARAATADAVKSTRQALTAAHHIAPMPPPDTPDGQPSDIIATRTVHEMPRIPGTTVTVTAYVDPDAPDDPTQAGPQYDTEAARNLYRHRWEFAVVGVAVSANNHPLGTATRGMLPHGIAGPDVEHFHDCLNGPAVDQLIRDATDDAVATLATIERNR